MAKYWVQPEMRDGLPIRYGVYRMGDMGPECYEGFTDPVEAQEYCNERNDPWWPEKE